MTTAPAVYGQVGQALGLAERTLSANWAPTLQSATCAEAWYALQLVATRGPRLARSELAGVLELRTSTPRPCNGFWLSRTAGLITDGDESSSPMRGRASQRPRENIAGPTVELLNRSTPATSRRPSNAQAITQRATERLAAIRTVDGPRDHQWRVRLMAQPSLFIYRRRHRYADDPQRQAREVQRRRRCARPSPFRPGRSPAWHRTRPLGTGGPTNAIARAGRSALGRVAVEGPPQTCRASPVPMQALPARCRHADAIPLP